MKRQISCPHSGEILAEEFLKLMDITPYRLAKEIHVPLTRIAAILAGKRTVTVGTALRLPRFFGTSEGFWSGLQMDYDTAIANTHWPKNSQTLRPTTTTWRWRPDA